MEHAWTPPSEFLVCFVLFSFDLRSCAIQKRVAYFGYIAVLDDSCEAHALAGPPSFASPPQPGPAR